MEEFKIYKRDDGFKFAQFTDRYAHTCSIQKSSLGTEDAIWIGVNDVDPKIRVTNAKKLGIITNETTGWIPYPVPEDVSFYSRMHLTKKQVKQLLPILQKFVQTGDL